MAQGDRDHTACTICECEFAGLVNFALPFFYILIITAYHVESWNARRVER